jgi:hypothetical protein
MIRLITFGNTKVWLFIQQLCRHSAGDIKNLDLTDKYLCYFKFSEPTTISYGELICDPNSDAPLIFNSHIEAEKFAASFLDKRFQLKK